MFTQQSFYNSLVEKKTSCDQAAGGLQVGSGHHCGTLASLPDDGSNKGWAPTAPPQSSGVLDLQCQDKIELNELAQMAEAIFVSQAAPDTFFMPRVQVTWMPNPKLNHTWVRASQY